MRQQRNPEDVMRTTRRDLMQATAATALAGFVGDAAVAESAGAVRVGLLTVHKALQYVV
jgi:hypothetical protein